MCVSNHEKCKKSGMVFELHIKIRSRAIFEQQTTAAPKAYGFLFFQEVSQTKDVLQPVPDQERTKSPLKRRSYLSVSMKGTVQYCTETNVMERIFQFSLQNITGSILSFAKKYLGQNCCLYSMKN